MATERQPNVRMERRPLVFYTHGNMTMVPGRIAPKVGWAIYFADHDEKNEIGWVAMPQSSERNQLAPILRVLMMVQGQANAVTCYTSSIYADFVFNNERGIRLWKYNGWITDNDQPVADQDLLNPLEAFMRQCHLTVVYVSPHENMPQMNKVNEMVRFAQGIYNQGLHFIGDEERRHPGVLHSFHSVSERF